MGPRLALGLAVLCLLAGAPAASAHWGLQTVPARGTDTTLSDVSCPSYEWCMAVGSSFPRQHLDTLAERWEGSTWSLTRTVDPVADENALSGVSCPAVGMCMAVGSATGGPGQSTLAEEWDGTSWQFWGTPNPDATHGLNELRAVSCGSPDSCMAVGDYADARRDPATLAEYWNGSRWTLESTPNPRATQSRYSQARYLSGVSCTTATSCVAVGNWIMQTVGGLADTGTLVEHWNGTSWSVQKSPNPHGATSSSLRTVACTSPDACTAVGHYSAGADRGSAHTQHRLGLVERWNGMHWSIQRVPSPARAQNSFLTGVSCATDTACTAVGIYDLGHGHHAALSERWNGSRWTVGHPKAPDGALTSALTAVSCRFASVCTAVGNWSRKPPAATVNQPLAERYA